jgi:hypothetical protein
MITQNPPATWDSQQLVNPEKLNRNLLAAQDQLGRFAQQKWNRFTVISYMGTIAPSGDSIFAMPFITGVPYIVERITVYGNITGSDAVLSWSDSVNQPGTIPLNAGELDVDNQGPVRAVALPAWSVDGSDWSDVFSIVINANTSTCTNIRIEVGIRILRSTATTSTYTPDMALWQAGDIPLASRFNAQLSDLNTFQADWTDGYATNPAGIHYVEFLNFDYSVPAVATRDSLPGSGGEQVVKILARAEMLSVGDGGQFVDLFASYGAYTSTPSLLGSFSVSALDVANYTSGAVSLQDSVRSPLVAADDFTVAGTTTGATVAKLGIWIIKRKI